MHRRLKSIDTKRNKMDVKKISIEYVNGMVLSIDGEGIAEFDMRHDTVFKTKPSVDAATNTAAEVRHPVGSMKTTMRIKLNLIHNPENMTKIEPANKPEPDKQ